jgi:hypothetical protein
MRREPLAPNADSSSWEKIVMTSITSLREHLGRPHQADDGIMRDFRQRLADEQFERAERKRLELANQRSELNDAEARIQAWEKAHALRMPTSPTHPVLQVIAAATDLTLKQVLDEQRYRSGQVRAAQPA